MRIVFMGTPDFARASLQALLDMPEHTVTGVFCQPDRPSGRGLKVVPCPVKQLALEHGLPVFQPVKMRGGSAAEILRGLEPDLVVAVAYGRILPRDMLVIAPFGCINIHASLLPELRGAAPIQWAIARGYETTGVTAQYMAEECDAGDIIFQESTPIGERETSGDLHDRLRDIGAALLQRAVRAIADENAYPVQQNHAKATFAPIIKKSDGVIDPSRSVREADRLIRAMNPWPGAYLGDLKIYRARPADMPVEGEPRFIRCADGLLELLEVQAPGKRRMSAEDYFRGRRGG